MTKEIPNTPKNNEAISQLIKNNLYSGDIGRKGFIIKRNFGVRRLPIYGKFTEENISISPKNEILHQTLYVFGFLLFTSLILLTLYNQQFILSILLSIIVILMILDDTHRKNKELKTFLEEMEKLK